MAEVVALRHRSQVVLHVPDDSLDLPRFVIDRYLEASDALEHRVDFDFTFFDDVESLRRLAHVVDDLASFVVDLLDAVLDDDNNLGPRPRLKQGGEIHQEFQSVLFIFY